MNFHRILLKIAYWLVAFSIVVLLALTFYGNHLVKKQAAAQAPKTRTTAETDTETNISYSGMSIRVDNSRTKKESEKSRFPSYEETIDEDKAEELK